MRGAELGNLQGSRHPSCGRREGSCSHRAPAAAGGFVCAVVTARSSARCPGRRIAARSRGVRIGDLVASVVLASHHDVDAVLLGDAARVADLGVEGQDVFDEQLAAPQYPDVVSGPEAADILGVSNQRLDQLAVEHPDFPDPIYVLRAGKIWLRAAIEAFNASWVCGGSGVRRVPEPRRRQYRPRTVGARLECAGRRA